MNVSEIVNEVKSLSVFEQRQILEVLQENESPDSLDKKRDEFHRRLVAKGMLKEIPPRKNVPRSFEPVPISGKPISETIIEERG